MSARASLLLVVAALGALTWLIGDPGFRTRSVPGGPLLEALPSASSAWRETGPEGAFELGDAAITVRNRTAERVSLVHEIALPDTLPSTLLVARGRLDRLGEPAFVLDPSRRARAFLRFADAAGATLGYATLVQFGGLLPARSFENVAALPAGTRRMELFVVADTVGAWRLDRLVIEPVASAPRYRVALAAVAVGWVGAFGTLLARLIRRGGQPGGLQGGKGGGVVLRAALVAALAALVLSVALTQPLVRALVAPLAAVLQAVVPDTPLPAVSSLLKIGHAVGFAVLIVALLVTRRVTGLGASGAVALALLLALATEALQRHHPGRSAELTDIGIDAVGIGVGALAWAMAWVTVRTLGRALSGRRTATLRP